MSHIALPGTFKTSLEAIYGAEATEGPYGREAMEGARREDGTCCHHRRNGRQGIDYKERAFNTPLTGSQCNQAQYVTRMINGKPKTKRVRVRRAAAVGPGVRRSWLLPR